MNNFIEIFVEVRIDALSDKTARKYAAAHSIDINIDDAKWSPNLDGKGGRLYASTTLSSLAGQGQLSSHPHNIFQSRKRIFEHRS